MTDTEMRGSGADRTLPTLTDQSVVLRPADSQELDALAELIAADAQTSPWWSENPEIIRRWFADPDYHVLVIEDSSMTVGVIAFEEEDDPDYRAASIDIALLSCCVGRGLGTRALRMLIRWLIEDRGHHRITLDPAVANERAIHTYEKVGFRPVGVMRDYERGSDGTWHDNLLMDMLAEDFERARADTAG